MLLTSPLTGAAQTGLTSPTFTLLDDTAPSSNGKQMYVSAVGGTQIGVEENSISRPFTLTMFKPANIKVPTAGILEAAGLITNVPKNTNKVKTRKSVSVNAVGGYGLLDITTTFDIPVNSPESDLVSIKSAISAHIGALQQDLDQWYSAILSGAL